MRDYRSMPTALRVVAILFLLYGIGAIFSMIAHVLSGTIHLDLGFLGIPTYFGLRRFSTGWRTFALVCLWVSLIACPLAFVVGLMGGVPTYFQIFGFRIARIAPIWLSLIAAPAFLLSLWQYRVLTRPDVRALFFPPAQAPSVA